MRLRSPEPTARCVLLCSYRLNFWPACGRLRVAGAMRVQTCDLFSALIGKHFHRFLYSFLSCLWLFCLGNPLQIVSSVRTLAARKKFIQPTFFQGIGKILWNVVHIVSVFYTANAA